MFLLFLQELFLIQTHRSCLSKCPVVCVQQRMLSYRVLISHQTYISVWPQLGKYQYWHFPVKRVRPCWPLYPYRQVRFSVYHDTQVFTKPSSPEHDIPGSTWTLSWPSLCGDSWSPGMNGWCLAIPPQGDCCCIRLVDKSPSRSFCHSPTCWAASLLSIA